MKVTSRFLSFTSIFCMAAAVASAGPELPGNIKGYKKETLEVYFNRADLEREGSSWEDVARFGAEAAISVWEREASDLYTDPGQMALAKGELSGWVGAQLRERYEAWLTRHFFDTQGAFGTEAVLRAIREADLQYLYTTDGAGNIVLDERGDPVLRGATGVDTDRAGWKARVSAATDEVLAAWESRVDAAFAPELGSFLGPEALARYGEYKVGFEAGLRREMERVALQGEMSLAARRLYDQYSLRKKSESATADAIAEQIVRETRQQTDEGIDQIRASLALTPDSVDSSIPSIQADTWLESFKTAFEKGLSKWDSAEEKFLTSRMEWERDSGSAYKEGEGAWSTAFDRLRTERRSWEQQVDSLLQQGAARWDQSRSELSAAIEGAREEFRKERTERLGAMEDQVGALVDMYAQSVNVVSTAVSSGQELIKKLDIKASNGEYVKFSKDAIPALAAWRTTTWAGYISRMNADNASYASQKSAAQSWISQYQDILANPVLGEIFLKFYGPKMASEQETVLRLTTILTASIPLVNQMSHVDASGPIQGENPALVQALAAYENFLAQTMSNPAQAAAVQTAWERMTRIGDWLTLIDTYTAQAATARQQLEQTLGKAFGSEALDLRDVLKTDTGSDVTYLDEYQLELLRARAVEDYWKQRKAVADQVVAYAQDISSGRETEDQGVKKYTAARSDYEARLAEYNLILEGLKAGGADLASARAALEAAQRATDEASAAYEEARTKYLDSLVSTQSGNVDFYRGQIEQKYAELLSASGMTSGDTELSDAAGAYFTAARRHGFDLAVNRAWQSAARLVSGNPESGLASLADLKARADRIQAPASVGGLPLSFEALGFVPDDPDYAKASALYAAWRDAQAGDEKGLAAWKLIQFAGMADAQASAAYEERLALVRAYGAVDGEAWYSESGGTRGGGSLSSRLSTDSTAAFLSLVTARAEAERRGLSAWVQVQDGQTPSDLDALMLSRSAQSGLGLDEALSRIAALGQLISALDSAGGDPAAGASRLKELTSRGGWIQAFVGGRGTFMDAQAGDLALALCNGQYREAERARRLAAAWREAASDSTALVAEREAAALEAVRIAFLSHGILAAPAGMLPSSEDIAVTIRSMGATEAARYIAELSQDLEAAAASGPQWLGDRLSEYSSALAAYAAAEAVRGGSAQAAEARAAAEDAAAVQASAASESLGTLTASLAGEERFAALVELYSRTDAPSASASSARTLVVNEGAVKAARQSLADPTLSLGTIAAGLTPGMPSSLAEDIAARAAELLLAANGAGSTGQRLAAYRTWNSLSLADAAAGLTTSAFASEAKKLWDEVASRSWDSPEALSAALNEFLADFDESHPARLAIQSLCAQIEAGYADRETLFRRFLFGDDFDTRIAVYRGLGAAGVVYERAAALKIVAGTSATQEGRALAAFLRDRTGIASAVDVVDYAGQTFDLEEAAYGGGGALAVEYLCRRLGVRGLSIPDSLLEKLQPADQEKVRDFETTLGRTRGYVSALDGTPQEYAQRLGEDFDDQYGLVASLATDQWDDEFFAAAAQGDYLGWYDAVMDAEMDAASQVIFSEAAQASLRLSREAAVHRAEASYWRMVGQKADQAASWRSYLTEANVGAAASVGSAAHSQTRDVTGYVRSASDPSENATLEAFNSIALQENAFAAQLAANGGDHQARAAFHDFLDSFSAGAAKESDLPGPGEQGADAAEGRYRAALARLDVLKEDIRRFGEALGLLDLGTAERQQKIASLKQEMDGLAAAMETRQAAADAALEAFQESGDTYNRLYGELQGSADRLEQARFSLRVREEIRDWAANGYLATSGESSQGYQSPADRQAEAAGKLVRATAALDALKSLNGSGAVAERPVGDTDTLAAYEAWKASYGKLLQMNRMTGDLDEAVVWQAKKSEENYVALQDSRDAVLDWKTAVGNLGAAWASGAEAAEGRAGTWADYLTLKDGEIVLNISSGFVVQVQSTQTEWQEIKDFFEKKERRAGDAPEAQDKSAFERTMEAWTVAVEKVSGRVGGMSALIDRWGFAADYLKRRLYDNNEARVKNLLSSYSSDDQLMRLTNLLDLRVDDGYYGGIARNCLSNAVAYAHSMYDQVMKDDVERKAFELYFAVRMAGKDSVSNNSLDQFNSRVTASALTAFSGIIMSRVRTLRDNANAPFGWITNIWEKWTGKADELFAVNGKISGVLSGFNADPLGRNISTFKSAKSIYESSCARLAELRGTNGVPLDSFDALLTQYRKLAAQQSGLSADRVTIPADVESLLRTGWGRLGVVDKVSFSTALGRMAALVNADAEGARQAALLASQKAQGKEAEAQQAYRAAYEAFLQGSETRDQLLSAARRSYKDSAWAGKAWAELRASLFDDASFGGGVMLNAAETAARVGALRQFAQGILAGYAGALDSHGAALEQVWSQSVDDLGDRRQSWYAQAGLVRAKAASAWEMSQQKLVRAWGEWREGFSQEYEQKSEAWRVAYLGMGERKLEWVDEVREKAGQAGNEAILSEVGASADDSARNASGLLVGRMSYDAGEASAKVEALLGEVGSAQALSTLRRMSEGAGQGPVVAASGRLGVDTSGVKIAAEVKRFLQASRKDLSLMAARGLADDARASVEEAKKALAEGVKQANEGFEQSMDETFLSEGYRKNGGEYRREAVVRSTFFDYAKTETQAVGGYRWYAMPAMVVKVDLSPGRLSGLEAGAVVDLVGVAQAEVAGQQKRIFGEGKKLSSEQKKSMGLLVEFSANGKSITRETGEGEFGKHIGYAPEFTNEPDFDASQSRNIVVRGSGELGRLMGDFIWYQMKESRGWAEMAQPAWDKALWDDTGSWFKAPSIRTVGTIAAGIAAAVIVPGGGAMTLGTMLASAAISTSATVAFDTLDVVYGYKTWEEAGLDIGKSFLTSAVTSTIGGVFNGFDPGKVGGGFLDTGISGALGSFGKGAVGKALLAGAQSFTTNTATSALNAFTWSKEGGFGWDKDSFLTGSFGVGSMASSIGAAAGSFTTTGLTKSLSVADNKFYNGAVSLAGGAATELARYGTYVGYEYASGRGGSLSDIMSRAYGNMGGVTVNVANAGAILDMIGTGVAMNSEGGQSDLGRYAQMLSGSGLMELNFGPRGITGRLGTGGTDVGGGMYRLAKGMADKRLLEDYQRADSRRGTIAMNAYVYGDWTAENTARRLGVGKDELTFGFEGARGKIDENTKGYTQTDGKGGRTIFLKEGGTEPGSLLNQAIMLQHEAYRNGVVDADNGLETYRAVTAHTIMAAQFEKRGLLDSELQNDVDAYKKGDAAFRQYVGDTYDSSSDYWKAVKTNRGVGWIADGKTTFDVSDVIEGGGTALASLDEATIQQLWQVQQGVISGTIEGGAAVSDAAGVFYRPEFADFAAFSGAMLQYNLASMRINSTMALFNGNNAPDQVAVNNALAGSMDALQAVQAGGLLVKTETVLTDPGPGRHIFASRAGETLSSYAGYRIEIWSAGEPVSANPHNGWDVWAPDARLVAPDAGSLSLTYSNSGGLATQFTDAEQQNREIVRHTDVATLTQFLTSFGMIGTTLNAGVLDGIQQNMVIGRMGNTGERTTGPHGHLEYSSWNAGRGVFENRDPSNYFGANYFQRITPYASMISGLQQQLSTSDLFNAWDYAQAQRTESGTLDFQAFRNNPANQQRFTEVDWQDLDKRIYREMQRRNGR